jgi:lipid-A-disaccharide synthase
LRKRVWISAGETSGDLYGAHLARALRSLEPQIQLAGLGGRQMMQAGVDIVDDPTGRSSVGLVEAIQNLPYFLRLFRTSIYKLDRYQPDVVVLIDSPEFNLRFAEYVYQRLIPIVYYVSPQVWAWRKGRVRKIARLVRKMLVIFEFEYELYRRAGVEVTFVGHPLLDIILGQPQVIDLRKELNMPQDRLVIGLLPGSREREFGRLFWRMARAGELIASEFPGTRFLLACAPGLSRQKVLKWTRSTGLDLTLLYDRTYDVMRASDMLLVASGTATIEAAILGVPMIVTYVVSPLTTLFFSIFVRFRYLAMVNIVAGKDVVPEYYQTRARPELLAKEAISMIKDRLNHIRQMLRGVRERLGTPGANLRAASEILRLLG